MMGHFVTFLPPKYIMIKKIKRVLEDPHKAVVKFRDRLVRRGLLLQYGKYGKDLKRYPVIWVRTPKCASSSILAVLEASDCVVNWTVTRDAVVEPSVLRRKIICVGADVKEEFRENHPQLWSRAFKWAVVRNPFDKTISAWKYLDSISEVALRDVLVSPPGKKQSPSDYHHFTASQFDLLAIDGRLSADKVIYYETLEVDLKRLFEDLGVPFKGLPKLNRTPSREGVGKMMLDASVVNAIVLRFASDFECFGYLTDPNHSLPGAR